MILRQSTAVTIVLSQAVDSTDGATPETALTISQADVRLSKNGGAFAQKNESSSASHLENGYYACPLNTTDTNTLGILKVAVTETGALPMSVTCHVVTANVYDTLFSTDKLQVHVDEMTAGIITAAAIATNAIDADALAADAVAEIQSGLATSASVSALNDLSTSDVASQLSAIGLDHLLSASVSGTDVTDNSVVAKLVSSSATADWDTFNNTTDSLQAARDAQLTAAAVNSEVDTALSDIGLDHLLSASVSGTDVTDDSVVAKLASSSATADWDTFDNTTDSLEAADAARALRTGYKLASDGLDLISVTAPSGVAANFREMLVQVWRLAFKKSTLTSTELKTYADDGTTVMTTQTVTEDGTTQTKNAAS